MMKKVFALLFAVLLCASVYHYAFADSIFTEACAAKVLARQLLKDTYGLDQSLTAYFTEAVIEEDGGYRIVFYSTFDDLDYVLGRYTVEFKGDNSSISWSWDNQEVKYREFGLASNAWGKEQLKEIWLINKQTSSMMNYAQIANSLSSAAGNLYAGYIAPIPESASVAEYGDYDPSKAALTIADSQNIALKAIQEAYGLSDERMEKFRFESDEIWYESIADGIPAATIACILWDEENEWTEGDGNYYVVVNQSNGLVEDIYYLDGIIGNG